MTLQFLIFWSDNPLKGLIIVLLTYWAVTFPLRLIRLYIRHRTIRAKGYPPAWCDVDGNIKSGGDDVEVR